ncbi:MAG: CDP-diacylglycerol--glycerol-3-phosphate 3-phosphatidyltransferase [Deltaproteobacteria bacterium]|nr:CDP-diacylglycerol--glycerol-3-phosphate 3-phosphatidyltransferase [Deltaproteobacteria bacterium]
MEKSVGIVAKKQTQAIVWNLPNLLSVFRILTVPLIVVCLFWPSPFASFFAALIFSIASITDLLDGYIARYQKSETAIGKLLDPLADKLLINSALIMLIPLGRVPAWMVVLIVAREVAVTGLRGIASIEGLVIAASSWGKAKTIFQTFALIGLLLHYEYFRIDFHLLGMILMWIALAITLWSGFDYFYKFYQAQDDKSGKSGDGKMKE